MKIPSDHAITAADAIQKMNHALINSGNTSAPEISATVQALITLVDRLPEALGRLSNHLVREEKAARVRMDDNSDPAKAVVWVDTFLTDADSDLADVSKSLHAAGSLLFKMGQPYEGEDEVR
ncbi:hypothetical protein ACFXDJ_06715 [Streptomyces sp. NPDC059443]|uniref:hypothetical protein n=1 Tax=unclassified Streptomyces TaxID=2593676 RepID=UPI00367C6608